MWAHVAINISKRLPEHLEGEPIQVQGVIVSLPEKTSEGIRFEFEIKNSVPRTLWPDPGRVMLSYSEKYNQKKIKKTKVGVNSEKNIDSKVSPNPSSLYKDELRPSFKGEQLKVGDEWVFWVKLKKPRSYSNPGSFDKEKYYFQNRLQAQGRILLKLPKLLSRMRKQPRTNINPNMDSNINTNTHVNTNIHTNTHPNAFSNINCNPKKIASDWTSAPIHRLRSFLHEKIQENLASKKFSALISALVLGIREGITREQWTIFQNTGTAHLMAISGLHVGLVASLFYVITFWIWRCLPIFFLRIPASLAAAFSSIFSAFLYAVLAGFSIPTQRALVMILLFMIAALTRRIGLAWRNYFLALAAVLLMDPFSTLSIGFWLSFAAVGMMLYGLKGRLYTAGTEGIWWKWGRAQWVVFLGLMPLTLASFNQVSLISPIANIIAIPWVSFIVVPFAIFGSLMLMISDRLGILLLQGSEYCFGLLWPILNFFSTLPMATWSPGSFSKWTVLWAMIGTIILLVPRGFPGRWLGLIFLLPLFLPKPHHPELGTAKFTLLDVGQGLAAIVETAHHVLIFDTGPKLSKEVNTGAQVVLPFLKNQGIKKIDTVVISHGDNDHIGGLQSILENIKVEEILSSDIYSVGKIMTASKSGSGSEAGSDSESRSASASETNLAIEPKIKHCYAGQRWNWDGVEFEMIHPESSNSNGFSNRVSNGVPNGSYSEISNGVYSGNTSGVSNGIARAKRNDHCCVLQIKAGQQKVLLTGDIEKASERKLLDNYSQSLASSFLIVPHHGSKTSSTLEFIQAVNPAYALIPVGYLNPYGHPKAEILERYRNMNIPLRDTVQEGAISFTLRDQSELESPKGFRNVDKHFWQY